MSLFKRFVQIGRVVLINSGPDANKLAVIVDVLDQNRAFVDGPANVTGVQRQVINFKQLSLTDFTISVPRGVRQKSLSKAFLAADIVNKFNATAWGRRIQNRAARAQHTDFDRFQVLVARKARNAAIRVEQRKLIKQSRSQSRSSSK